MIVASAMEKLITIIIPTYNMERYLAKCLDTLVISDENMGLLCGRVTSRGQ